MAVKKLNSSLRESRQSVALRGDPTHRSAQAEARQAGGAARSADAGRLKPAAKAVGFYWALCGIAEAMP